MGFFGKIKQNLKHGGVSVKLQAANTVAMNDPGFPVSVTVTAKDSAQKINSIKVELIAQEQDRATDTNAASMTPMTIAAIEAPDAFTLAGGETKTIELKLMMNLGAGLTSQLPADSALGKLGGVLSKIESVTSALDNRQYIYRLDASADVDGISLDPSDSQTMQVLKPGQLGGGLNLHLGN